MNRNTARFPLPKALMTSAEARAKAAILKAQLSTIQGQLVDCAECVPLDESNALFDAANYCEYAQDSISKAADIRDGNLSRGE